MPAPPLIRLGSSCCNHLVRCSLNNNYNLLLRCQLSVIRSRSVAYTTTTTCADQQVSSDSSSSDTSSHPIKKQKLGGKFKVSTDQWKRERMSASVLFARQLKESSCKHDDVETYMTIVRLLLSHSGMDVRLYHLFMYVLDHQNIINICHLLEALIEEKLIKAVEVLVEVYASVGRFEEAMLTLSAMRSRGGLMVSTRTCNFLMNELIEWGKADMVDSVYIQLKMNGLIPNVYTYGIMMKGYCRKDSLMDAGNLLLTMSLDHVEPNGFIYGSYIHMLCSRWPTDWAFDELKFLRKFNKPADDAFSYSYVIRGFVEESKLQDAEDVFLDMKLRQVVPDAHCYSALIQGYRQKGDTAKALDLCKEMESRLGIKSDDVIARSMMQRLCDLGRSAEALYKFKGFMQSGVFLHGVTFNMAIDVACKLGRMDDAMGLIQGMKARQMNPMKKHYRTLMNGYCLRGEPWNALYMFQEMLRNGFRPDSTTYHVLACGGVSLPLYMLFK